MTPLYLLKRHSYNIHVYCGLARDYMEQGTGVPGRVTCKLCIRNLRKVGLR